MDCNRLYEVGFVEYVGELSVKGFLRGAPKGIALQVVNEGHAKHLSEKQIAKLINDGLLNGNYIETCGKCHETISWYEMYNAVNSGLCGKCSNLK